VLNQLLIKKITLIVCVFVCLYSHNIAVASTIYSEITQPLFGEVTPKLGEATGATLKLHKDKDGLLWLLDNNYLFKFDGYEYERINFLPDNKTYQLSDFAIDQHDNIWIASKDVGVFKYSIKTQKSQQLFTHHNTGPQLALTSALHLFIEGTFIYIITELAIYKVNTDNYSYSQHTFEEASIVASLIYKDNQNTLWVATNDGLYNLVNNTLTKFVSANELFDHAQIRAIHQSNDNKIWITTTFSGAWIFDKQTNKLTELSKQPDSKTLDKIIELEDKIWFQTGDNGIEVRELSSGDFIKRIEHDISVKNSLSTNQVTSLYKDNSGVVWVGTRGPKLHYYHSPNQAFSYARPSPRVKHAISYARIRGIGQLSNDTLLLSSLAAGAIDVITPKEGKVDQIILTTTHREKKRQLIANQFYQDSEHTVWIVTFPAFLVHYNFKTKEAEYFPAPLLKQRNGAILNIIKDPKAPTLWLAMSEGLLSFDLVTKTFSRPDFNFNGPLYTLAADSEGNVWTGNKKGLYWFEYLTQKWHHLASDVSTNSTLTNNQISSVFVDSKDQLWVGSQFQLFKKQQIKNHQVIFDEIILPNLTEQIQTTNLLEDNQGNIWISRHAFFNPITYKTFETSTLSPFDRNSFNSVFLKTKQGELLFAGDEGLNFINPSAILPVTKKLNLLVNSVTIDDENITFSNQVIIIPPKTKNTSIHFTGIDLTQKEPLTYQYRIVGYNSKWRDTEHNSRFISFTALPPGNYSIEIKVTDHLTNSTVETLAVIVLPTFYQTLWFKFVTLLTVLVAIWLFIRWRVDKQAKVERKHNEMKLAAEQAENIAKLASERATMMDDVLLKKNQLLADVSHELRTPLTVLQIEIETLQHDFSDDVQASYKALRKKVSDMNNLIDDISELAKSDIGALKFNFSMEQVKPLSLKLEQELKRFVTANGYQWLSHIIVDDNLLLELDKAKIKQLLINLISNSIKYTNVGGKIELEISQAEQYLIVKVSDSAPTVTIDNLEKIFDRLFRVESSRSRNTGGSGLGLSICKSIVQAHKGEIFALQSSLGGISIVIKLPVG